MWGSIFRKGTYFTVREILIVLIAKRNCKATRNVRYPAWYPLDWYNDRTNYSIVYCYQVIGIIFEATGTVLLELFAIYLMIVAGTYLDILAMRLGNLGASDSSVEEDESYNELIDCIEVHKSILKYLSTTGRLLYFSVTNRFTIQFPERHSEFVLCAILCSVHY